MKSMLPSWDSHDPVAAEMVAKVYRMRHEFICSMFAEMGFAGRELEIRTRLWLCYATHGTSLFGKGSKKERDELLKLRHRILTAETKTKGKD